MPTEPTRSVHLQPDLIGPLTRLFVSLNKIAKNQEAREKRLKPRQPNSPDPATSPESSR